MTHSMPQGLPDPEVAAEFYKDVPVKRLIAWIIDSILIAILTTLVLPFTAFVGIFFFVALYGIGGFFYRWATLAMGSATLGMRLASIELRMLSGDKLSGGGAFLHTLGYIVSVSVTPLQLISIVLMLFSARKQGLTDHILGTAAINKAARF